MSSSWVKIAFFGYCHIRLEFWSKYSHFGCWVAPFFVYKSLSFKAKTFFLGTKLYVGVVNNPLKFHGASPIQSRAIAILIQLLGPKIVLGWPLLANFQPKTWFLKW